MIKKNYSLYKVIVMMLTVCAIWLGGEVCIVEAQTKGQIICTNNTSEYPNATVLNLDNTDFFSSTYEKDGYRCNPFELHIKKDTTLVINGPVSVNGTKYRRANATKTSVTGSINYLEGIIIYPQVTLTIRLENSSNFYLYGKMEPTGNGKDWMGHAGIEVPYSSTLIIEQTKNVGGALIAVGAGSQKPVKDSDTGNGTGAGIGGRGYQFLQQRDDCRYMVEGNAYTYADCGTVIIRSGKIYACGGCGIGGDGKGTGAGIGGGGVWRGNFEHRGSVYSGRGGDITIYGGYVEAYGGGTFNSDGSEKNIYYDKKDIFFNWNNGFYIQDLSSAKNDQAEGVGAGIGGGGLYTDNEVSVHMKTELKLNYYGGCVHAFAGRGSNKDGGSKTTRGVGAGIGGGGCFTSDGDASAVYFTHDNSETDHSEVKVGYQYGASQLNSISTLKGLYAHNKEGVGAPSYSNVASLGGWSSNGKDKNERGAGNRIDPSVISGSVSNYGNTITGYYPIYNLPKQAYSDIVAPKIESMAYTVCEFNDLENSNVSASLSGKSFNCDNVESAITAAGGSVTSKSSLVAKITVSDKDTGSVNNFGDTIGHGIKKLYVGTEAIEFDFWDSYTVGAITKVSSNVYIKILEAGKFNSSAYGTKDANAIYVSRAEIYIIAREDFTIKVKDIGDREKSTTVEVSMPEFEEDLGVLVQYILKTDLGKTYPDMQENNAFDGVKTGETVVSEDLVITVTSNLSGGSDVVSEMVLKKGDEALKTVNNTNTMTYTATENNTYILHIKSKFESEMDLEVKVTKIGEKKDSSTSASGFLIPNISISTVSFNDTTNNNGLINNATSGLTIDSPIAPGLATSIESLELPVDVSGVQVSIPEVELDKISVSDLSVGNIDFIRLDSFYDKINWNKNKKVDWDNTGGKITEILLRYKDVNSKDLYNVPLYQDSQLRSPLDTDNTIYTNGNSNSYVVDYYMQDRTSSGNGYTKLENYSDTYEGSIQKKMGVTDIVDIPYEGDKAISIRCEYANGKVKVILEPEELIVGSRIKEVGVRVEYELNGITTGLVHKWNYVEGQNGKFEHEFANIPKNNVTCTAYYITRDNEEFCSSTIKL